MYLRDIISRNENSLRPLALVLSVFLLVSTVPPSLADSFAPGVDQYESNKDRALESLSPCYLEDNLVKVNNDGPVPARVTRLAYRDGGIHLVDIPDVDLLPGGSATVDISGRSGIISALENGSRIAVLSGRGLFYTESTYGGGVDGVGENDENDENVKTVVSGETVSGAPVTVIVHSETRIFQTTADETGHFKVTIKNLKPEMEWTADVYRLEGSWTDWHLESSNRTQITRSKYRNLETGVVKLWGQDDGHDPTHKKVISKEKETSNWGSFGWWWPTTDYYKVKKIYSRSWDKNWNYEETKNFSKKPEPNNPSIDYRNINKHSTHKVKVIAGNANRNTKMDGPQTSGWKGYAENSLTQTHIPVGTKVKLGNIGLKYDPFDIQLLEKSDSMTRDWTLGTAHVTNRWTNTSSNWHDVKRTVNAGEQADTYRNSDGWRLDGEITKSHSKKGFDTRSSARNYASSKQHTKNIDTDKYSKVVDYDWRVDWTTSQTHSKTYDDWEDANDKKNFTGGSMESIWNDKDDWVSGHWAGGYDYKYSWKKYDRDWHSLPYPHWDSWEVVDSGSKTYESYKGSSFTNGGAFYQEWKKEYSYDSAVWDSTEEWISGHWGGGYDYKVTWTTTESHSQTFESHQNARDFSYGVNGSITPIPRYETKYKVSWDEITGYNLQRKRYTTRHHTSYERNWHAEPWNTKTTTVQVTSKNNYDGNIRLEPSSDGEISTEIGNREISPNSSAKTDLAMTPLGGASNHEVRVNAIDRTGKHEERETYNLNLHSSKPSPRTWTNSKVINRHWAPEPDMANLTILSQGPGTTSPDPDTYTHEKGTEVGLSAIPDTDATFVKWETGNGRTVSRSKNLTVKMNSDKTRVAVFETTEEPENPSLNAEPSSLTIDFGAGEELIQPREISEEWSITIRAKDYSGTVELSESIPKTKLEFSTDKIDFKNKKEAKIRVHVKEYKTCSILRCVWNEVGRVYEDKNFSDDVTWREEGQITAEGNGVSVKIPVTARYMRNISLYP